MVESPNNIASSVICVCPYHNLVRAPGVANMQERGGENGRSKKIGVGPVLPFYSSLFSYYFLTSFCKIIINLLTNVMPPISVY